MARIATKSFLIFLLIGLPALAQVGQGPPKDDSVSVTATARGAFIFTLGSTAYAFGEVSAAGGANVGGTEELTPVVNASNAVYSSVSGVTWQANSAPVRTVRMYNTSSASTITWGTADSLQISVPVVTGSSSCGFVPFSQNGDGSTATTCDNGMLLHGLSVGTFGKSGTLQFKLTVDESDDINLTNTWTVVITANGA